MQLLYLAEDDVKQCLTMREAIDVAERGITADGAGEVAGDKFYMHTGEAGFIKPFSGYLAGEDYAYVKTFSFYEGNRARGLPVTNSMVLLFDASTGLPVCIMEANHVTALKTGASTAVTARRLARPASKVAAIFGAGGLGRMHCLALAETFELDEVRVVDVRPEAANAFAVSMSAQTGLPISIARTPEEAVRGADIVITVTTGSAVNVEHGWLKRGAFVARLGSYQEVALDLFAQADKLIVARWRYVSARIPEMIALIDAGRLRREDLHAEWPDIAGGRAAGRETDEIILYVALGISGNSPPSCPKCTGRPWRAGWGRRRGLIARRCAILTA